MHTPNNLEQLRQAVVELRYVQVQGGGTKPGMSDGATISTRELTGVTQYDPGEYTFTAMAGTPLAEIHAMLAEHHQFLAFDPPLVRSGATLGGTVAAGLSGAGRLRFGGLRDFLLGVRLVTGEGRLVFGGGKVVKNAAGFDIPKLMVGARGEYGVLAELTFKVFPRPESYVTLAVECPSLEQALELQSQIAASPLEPACLDMLPSAQLFVRLGGLQAAQAARIERLQRLCHRADAIEVIDDDQSLWDDCGELSWAVGCEFLARIAISPNEIQGLEQKLSSWGAERRYSVGGNLVWLACRSLPEAAQVEQLSQQLDRPISILRGVHTSMAMATHGHGFRRRLKTVFDPQGKFVAALKTR